MGVSILSAQAEPTNCSIVIFHAPLVEAAIERAVGLAQRAASRDLLMIAAQLGFRRVFIVGAESEFASAIAAETGLDVVLDPDPDASFHFGERLLQLVARHHLDRIIYLGGGAAPLLSGAELIALATAISGAETAVIANIVYSADIVAIGPGAEAALRRIVPPALDNDLAFRLLRAGLPTTAPAYSLGLHFDIDTPSDLTMLALSLEQSSAAAPLGPHLSTAIADYLSSGLGERQMTTLRAALAVVSRDDREALFCGRIGAQTWRRLEVGLPCQTRLLGEERGMRASGREEQGKVRSLLGFLVEHAGAGRAIDDLTQLAQAAFIDTRVLFNHLHLNPGASDRFNSDALRWEELTDSKVRDFTRAAAEAPIPIILGGHSLVSGGLTLLVALVQELHKTD